MKMSPPPPDHPVLVEVDAKRVDAGDEHVEPEVELVAVDEQRVGDVALDYDRVLLLHLLLLLRVHFDLARDLWTRKNIIWSYPLVTKSPYLESQSRTLQCRTCCLATSQCRPGEKEKIT